MTQGAAWRALLSAPSRVFRAELNTFKHPLILSFIFQKMECLR